jgi:hypothetical protein
MAPIPLSDLRSNWQFVVFYFIDRHVNDKQRRFSSTDIIRNAEEIHLLLAARGHKKKPENPEIILAKTLQNMRDKKPTWITFLDYRGEYELTDEGYQTLLMIKPRIKQIRENKVIFLKKAEDSLKQWEIDLEEFT